MVSNIRLQYFKKIKFTEIFYFFKIFAKNPPPEYANTPIETDLFGCQDLKSELLKGNFSIHQNCCLACRHSWYWTKNYPINKPYYQETQKHLKNIPLKYKDIALMCGYIESKN